MTDQKQGGQGDSSSKGAPQTDAPQKGDGSKSAAEQKGGSSGTTSGHQESGKSSDR